jgi:phosphoribosyl 1,2-cyclic phosphodiesterase
MKLQFLGTCGNIDARTEAHGRHTSTRIVHEGQAVIVDCGEDWLEEVEGWDAQAILITHAHPDHVGGLKHGAPCPVYAPRRAWEDMQNLEIEDRRVVQAREPLELVGIAFEAFPVEHSTNAPAVGYRIEAGGVALFYVPDVAAIPAQGQALVGLQLYVGDGATIKRSMVRRPDGVPVGHAAIREQLDWCQREGVSRAIFTHCGSQIVTGEQGEVKGMVRELAEERGVEARIAHDGLELSL